MTIAVRAAAWPDSQVHHPALTTNTDQLQLPTLILLTHHVVLEAQLGPLDECQSFNPTVTACFSSKQVTSHHVFSSSLFHKTEANFESPHQGRHRPHHHRLWSIQSSDPAESDLTTSTVHQQIICMIIINIQMEQWLHQLVNLPRLLVKKFPPVELAVEEPGWAGGWQRPSSGQAVPYCTRAWSGTRTIPALAPPPSQYYF